MEYPECDYQGMCNDVICRGISLAESYENWTRLAMSFADLGEDGRAMFHALAAVSPKYHEAENDKKFTRCLNSARKITIATFVRMVQDAGVDVSKFYHHGDDGYKPAKLIHPVRKAQPQQESKLYPIPLETYTKHASYNSVFVQSLFYFATDEQITDAVERFQLGAAHDRRVMFPRIDMDGKVWDVKVMGYTLDCKRIHENVDWAISRLIRQGKIPAGYKPPRTLFGLHQIGMKEHADKVCRIVESCKSAVIGSMAFPQYNWMATGGAMCDMAYMLRPLVERGKAIELIPDGGFLELWTDYAYKAYHTFIADGLHPNITINDYVGRFGTQEQINAGADVADILVPIMRQKIPQQGECEEVKSIPAKESPDEILLADMIRRNPILGTMVETFGLEIAV